MAKLKGIKFLETLLSEFNKIKGDDKTKCGIFYLNWKAETTVNESETDDEFESMYATIISNIQKSLGNDWVWSIDSFMDDNIDVSKYSPLASSRYIKSPKIRIRPSKKSLIIIRNIDDNEWFKSFLVRYLHPADHHVAISTKADKDFVKRLDFKYIRFPVKNCHSQTWKKEFHRQ